MKAALLSMLIASGCVAENPQYAAAHPSPDAGEDPGQTGGDVDGGDAIQGGAKDKKDPAVGLVWFSGGGFCTGTLIAPNVVLTAGHCVTDPVAGFYTGTGKGAPDVGSLPVSGFVEHAVIDQIAHPSYQDVNECPNPTFDVGLLRLAAPITNTAPLKIGNKPPRVGASCRTVGYGVHNNGTSGKITVEQRRNATEKVLAVDASSIKVGKKSGIVDHGDSGGPLLCGNKIVGTTSCGNDSSPQHTEAYSARVDTIADWIAQTIDAWK